MKRPDNPWAVILAAGDGTRLANLTTAADGTHVPKQFCSLSSDAPLLHDTLIRARRFAGPDRVLVVVAAQHRRWWQPLLSDLPAGKIILQSCNRGTGTGALLANWHVQRRDPAATIVFLPADHYIRDEWIVDDSIRDGVRWLSGNDDSVLLLGITPEEADPELGYIAPAGCSGGGMQAVRRFVEKPDAMAAARLIGAGSLWNSFIFAARSATLLDLFARRHADVVESIRLALVRDAWAELPGPMLAAVYPTLPLIDFSRHVAQGAEDMLRVLPVPACGWTDLGTPKRVGQCVTRLDPARPARPQRGTCPGSALHRTTHNWAWLPERHATIRRNFP